jgi:hypothetical protein
MSKRAVVLVAYIILQRKLLHRLAGELCWNFDAAAAAITAPTVLLGFMILTNSALELQ